MPAAAGSSLDGNSLNGVVRTPSRAIVWSWLQGVLQLRVGFA